MASVSRSESTGGGKGMSSWRLFYYLLPRQEIPPNQRTPIFLREMTYVPVWQRSTQIIKRTPFRLLGLLTVLYVGGLLVVNRSQTASCLTGLYLLLLPLLLFSLSLLLWILPLCVALAPIVVRERERESWELLCATPYSVEEILLNKMRAALWSLYYSLGRVGILQIQVLTMILLGAGAMQAISLVLDVEAIDIGPIARSLLCGGSLILVLLLTGIFFLDRAQQLVMMAVAALTMSSLSSSTRAAFTSALIVVFLAWGFDVAAAIGVLALQPAGATRHLEFGIGTVITLGPIVGYMIGLKWIDMLLVIGMTLIIREAVIRGLWRLAVRSASWV
jgi:hypothetical protein